MGDFIQDVELDFLSQAHLGNTIGEHELKTSPLMTKDAVDISRDFVQRGLLGSVLSVHADGLPEETADPRLYLNLNAPSSGLVCGVQGSGKSHTVSCILESSMIVDPRIGSLPAPLGTVVFHFDEENGQRPCEAAYLSALKSGVERGVQEVVVLVSPSNLQTRRRVYSSLKFVEVHPLRIAEKDLNAARMLSMMGCDNLDALPLYLHSALSILRNMGSDGFSYQEFKRQLAESDFNKAQGAMLQLRMDLLESFLRGTGPDVTSFFKAGRLVIIDISDPFVEASTAAMLFDICLGLFIEWKSTTGKLIVLDEAHKYLTNTDANRFTRTICSIIRQQRHLAARVIVSTQEPTVVPPSVLDLLSWIVAHRFSSPSWVGHLKRHVCVREDGDQGGGNPASMENTLEWGRKVMMLRTGEGIVFSPAAVFATEDGRQATLATGYAIIKTRPRLTSDGGESILATETRRGDAGSIPGKITELPHTGLPNAELPITELPTTELPTTELPTPPSSASSYELTFSPRPSFPFLPPNTPIPRIIDLVADLLPSAQFKVLRGTSGMRTQPVALPRAQQPREQLKPEDFPFTHRVVLRAFFSLTRAKLSPSIDVNALLDALQRENLDASNDHLKELVEDARKARVLIFSFDGKGEELAVIGDPTDIMDPLPRDETTLSPAPIPISSPTLASAAKSAPQVLETPPAVSIVMANRCPNVEETSITQTPPKKDTSRPPTPLKPPTTHVPPDLVADLLPSAHISVPVDTSNVKTQPVVQPDAQQTTAPIKLGDFPVTHRVVLLAFFSLSGDKPGASVGLSALLDALHQECHGVNRDYLRKLVQDARKARVLIFSTDGKGQESAVLGSPANVLDPLSQEETTPAVPPSSTPASTPKPTPQAVKVPPPLAAPTVHLSPNKESSGTPTPVKAPSHQIPLGSNHIPAPNVAHTYSTLISLLRKMHQAGVLSTDSTALGQAYKNAKLSYPGKLKTYLTNAQAAGVVDLTTEKIPRVALRALYLQTTAAPKPPAAKAAPTTATPPGMVSAAMLNTYSVLIQALRNLQQKGIPEPNISDLGAVIGGRKPPVYTGKLSKYLEGAADAKVVRLTGNTNSKKAIKLLV